jgi:hypothetical protein
MFQDTVKTALIKDHWTITDDPLRFRFGGVRMYVDLGAEKVIAAQKGTQKIAVEIKSFVKKPFLTEFHEAVGQFMNYRLVLHEKEPERTLYLAIPKDTYNSPYARSSCFGNERSEFPKRFG